MLCLVLLNQVRRQLEVMIANEMGIQNPKPLSTRASVEAIVKVRGWRGMYTGFIPHSGESRYHLPVLQLFLADSLPSPSLHHSTRHVRFVLVLESLARLLLSMI